MRKRLVTAVLLILVPVLCFTGCSIRSDGDVDVSLADVVEANRLDVLLDRYDNVFIQEDTVNINGFVENTSYSCFSSEDGQLVADLWQKDEESSMTVNVRDGIIYGMYDGEMDVAIVPEADYEARMEEMYPLLPGPEEELQSAVKENKEILVTTIRETFEDGSPSLGAEYRIHARTLRIRSVQVIAYNEKGQKKQIIGMTVTHNSKEQPDRSAWEAISAPEAGGVCVVDVVIEPGTGREEKRNLQVARGCSVNVVGTVDYELYSDEACTTMLPLVDTTGEKVTFYVKEAD